MYYRRKILLLLLETFGGELSKIHLQKFLFLFCRLESTTNVYDFIPYKYGCYSYQSVGDLHTLQKYGMVAETENGWCLKNYDKSIFSKVTMFDKTAINHLKREYKDASAEDLMRETYLKYPYWAINSIKAKKILSVKEYAEVEKEKPKKETTTLFTIGYEGLSIEKYFNLLIINNIKVLCDVRKNALSQKIGFSKSALQRVCEALQIKYVHIPELGIISEKRQSLKTQKDYDILFDEYETTQLPNQTDYIEQVFDLLEKHKRIALTCFEASFCQCHRSKIADAVAKLPQWEYELIHLNHNQNG